MKLFFKILLTSIPLGFGIVCSLMSIANVVKYTTLIDPDNYLVTDALIFGVIGFSLVIACSIKIIDSQKKHK